MSKYETHFKYEQFEYQEQDRQSHKERGKRKQRKHGRSAPHTRAIREMDDGIDSWVPTYVRNLDPKHHERQWVIDSLAHFYQDDIVSDVTRLVKGGKEANVYLALGHPNFGERLIAAKLYRPRMLRSLKNDALYKIGRQVLDEDGKEIRNRRERVAMAKKTKFGRRLDFDQWIGTEYRILEQLYEAGADVPKPIGYFQTTLLMGFIGDEYGAAPTLSEISIAREEAQPLFEQIMENVALMLSLGHIHGDLSAYNILYWEKKITIIDFPQMINAYKNPHAYKLLERDIQRVCEYLAKFGLTNSAKALTRTLWQTYIER